MTRLWPLLVLLVACGPPAREEELGDAGAEVDGGLGADASFEAGPPTRLEFQWSRAFSGALATWGLGLRVEPDGGLVASVSSGVELATVIGGAGEPGQTTITGRFKPAVLWLDAQGVLQRGRQVARDPGAPGNSTLMVSAPLGLAPDGAVSVAGTFKGRTLFLDGSIQDTLTQLNPGIEDRSEDPFIARFAADGSPAWLRRGTTPGPLAYTWFNSLAMLCDLPDGGLMVLGEVDGPGFTFVDQLFSEPRGAYLARLDAAGHLVWLVRHSGQLGTWGSMVLLPDGSLVAQLDVIGDVTLDVGTADTLTLHAGPGPVSTSVLARFDGSGHLVWVRVLNQVGRVQAVIASGDALRVVMASPDGGLLELVDGSGATVGSQTLPAGTSVVALDADGALDWVTPLPGEPGVSAAGPAGRILVPLYLLPDVTSVETAGGTVVLPTLPAGTMSTVVLAVVDRSGRLLDVSPLGFDLYIGRLSVGASGRVGLIGGYGGRWGFMQLVGQAPFSIAEDDQMAWVAAFDPVPVSSE